MPGKHPDTRIKPLPLANGHGRYIHNRFTRTDTCVRWVMAVTYNRYKCVTVPLLKRLRNGRFTSEPPPGSRSALKDPPELLENFRYNGFPRWRRRA
jgi:hypothetical protein